MPALDTIRHTFRRITRSGRPSRIETSERVRKRKAWATMFHDDGLVPNNPALPFVHYLSAVRLDDADDPAAVFETLFEENGWGGSWRNGIYDYVHYHPRTHEVLGVARGRARVRFGGKTGKVIKLKAGDVAILPAGTGHQALSASRDLLVVGAYPPDGTYDEYRDNPKDHGRAVKLIPDVPLPRKDPVYGARGPLKKLWQH